MKRRAIHIIVLGWVLFAGFTVLAQEGQNNEDILKTYMDEVISKVENNIQKLEGKANVALLMVLAVGIIAAIIAFLQKFEFKGNKLITAFLGLIIAVITVIDANLYPDHQTLKKKIAEARVLESQLDTKRLQPVKPEDKEARNKEIQEILHKLALISVELEKEVYLAENGIFTFDLIPSAYAQSQQLPSWIENPPSDNFYLYFVGNALDGSLAQAKELSLQDARAVAVDFMVSQLQRIEGIAASNINMETLSDKLIESAEVYRTHYYLKPDDNNYQYYTLLRLVKSFLEIDLTFFAIEKNIDIQETKKINQALQTAQSPRKAYYNERDVTYKALLNQAQESLNPADYEKFESARNIRKVGNPAKAVPLLEEIVDKYPAFYFGWYNLGLAYDALSDSAKADNAYRKAIQAESNQSVRDASIYNTYGDFLRRHNNYSEAIQWFKEALEINPNHAVAKSNLRIVQNVLDRQ